MKIDQKNIVIGFLVSFVLLLVLGYVIPFIGLYLALIIAGAFTGYMVNNEIRAGMIHGAIIGAFSGIAVIAILYLRIAGNAKLTGILLILGLWYIGVFIILGLIGGALGYLIKQRSKKSTNIE